MSLSVSPLVAGPTTNTEMVTVAIEHWPIPGRRAAYETWLTKIIPVAARCPGHRGVQVARPSGAQGHYTVTLRFDNVRSACDWLVSAARRELLAEVTPLLMCPESVRTVTGIEFWFTASQSPGRSAPAYKQVLVALSVIYPLTLAVPWLAQPILRSLTDWPLIAHLVDTGAVVCLMTLVIMPRYTRLLDGWLYR